MIGLELVVTINLNGFDIIDDEVWEDADLIDLLESMDSAKTLVWMKAEYDDDLGLWVDEHFESGQAAIDFIRNFDLRDYFGEEAVEEAQDKHAEEVREINEEYAPF